MRFGLAECFLISSGAIAGALLRHFANIGLGNSEQRLPLATLTVNLVGCLLIGWLYGSGWLAANEKLRLLIAVGFLGSLTTFSAFSLETLRRIEQGELLWAIGYVLLSTLGGLTAAAAGMGLGRWLR